MHGRLLWLDDREPNSEAIINPSMAQFQLWLAQAQHDYGNYSSVELSKLEAKASWGAQRSKTIFNPFTGELRKIDSNGEISEPTTVFLGAAR